MAEPSLVRALTWPESIAEVGGKACNLAALAAAGLPTPRSVVVTRAAWQLFVRGAVPEGTRVAPVPADDGASARALVHWLREMCASAGVPPPVAEELHSLQRASFGTKAVAVRSSAVAEDSEKFSFAGQYESFLNLTTPADTIEAVRQCWLQAISERVVEYQLALRVGEIPSPMAVLVQEMVFPQAAGVLFSRDPVTGDASTGWLTSNWGLGTTVVDGTVEADNFLLSQRDGSVLDITIGDKQDREDAAGQGGVIRTAQNLAARTLPSVTRSMVKEIWRMGRRAEETLGVPVDMEWAALRDGQIIVLQARPITVSPVTARERKP